MPNIDNDYVQSLYRQGHLPLSSSSLKKLYSQETMATFFKWDKMIKGKSLLGIHNNSLHDNSVQLFHRFARKWTFGNGEKSAIALARICDVNSKVAEELNRADLKATWQVIKMLFANQFGLLHSSKNSRSATKGRRMSESFSIHRHHHGRKITSIEKQINEELIDEKKVKSQDQRMISNSKLGKND
jgi:hypothetical protein